MRDSLPYDVSVITVSYNTKDLLAQCLRSVFEQTPSLKVEVIVVDNASADDSCRIVREEFPSVHLIANERNEGITRANNQGIRASSGRYVLLLNPDTVVLDRSIERMVTFLDDHPQIGACGCRLVDPDGIVQPSHFPFPTLLGALYTYSGLFERIPFLARLLVPARIDGPNQTRPVGVCATACLLVSRARIEDVGLMDESFFLYGDDVDLCKRMWECDWPVFYLAEGRVIHYEGASQSDNLARRRLRTLHGDLQYLRKWRGPTYTRAYQMVVWACSLYRYVKYRWRQPRTPDEAELFSEHIAFSRAILTGGFEAEPSAIQRNRR